MAISSDLKDDILPFPKTGCFHDYWIGLIANLNGETLFIDDVLMEYRRYDNNASSFTHNSKAKQIKSRIIILVNVLLYLTKSKARI